MSAPTRHNTVTDDEPANRHDLRCAVWTTLADPCDCRDEHGHTVTLPDPTALRAAYEQAWADMPLCERAAELDRIAAEGRTA